jgi:hypothetical protein
VGLESFSTQFDDEDGELPLRVFRLDPVNDPQIRLAAAAVDDRAVRPVRAV